MSVCNNFWLRSNVDFGQTMRQKYIISNISEEFLGKIRNYNFCGAWRKSNVTSSVV